MSSIGKNIKTLRTRNQMTQDVLAEQLCVTRQTISNYETGKSQPDIQTLMRLAEIFQVDLNEILYEPADRSTHRKGIITLVLRLFLAAALGWTLGLSIHYANTMDQGRAQALSIFLQLLLQPIYFFLLGWFATSSVRSLHSTALLSGSVRRWILIAVLLCSILLALALLPYYSIMLTTLGIPYLRVAPLWMQTTRWITQGRRFIWISLLLGSITGVCGPTKTKIS